MASEGYQRIDVFSSIQGRSVVVETSYGPIHVLISGDEDKAACVTFHEVGVNSSTCFQGLFSASDPKRSILLKNFCFYHMDFPGCEVPLQTQGNQGDQESFLTLDEVSLMVGEAMKQLNIKRAMGMGVGAGAYILAKTSTHFPKSFDGLVLFSPCCQKATWWEYAYGKVLQSCLWLYGWNSRASQKHLYQRLFTPTMASQSDYGVSDLLYTFNQEVQKINPKGVMRYLHAVLNRKDILEEAKQIACRVLLFTCVDSIYNQESLQMNFALNRKTSDYVEVFDSGTLITEQLPQETLRPVDQFIKLLHQSGLCR